MKIFESLKLFHLYLKHYYLVLIFLGFINILPGMMLSARPLVLAPALGQLIPSDVQPVSRWRDISLDNIGPSLQAWIGGNGISDLGRCFLFAAIFYFLITGLSALLTTFVNVYALRIRMKVFRNMITALHSHLLSLDISFFIQRMTGELVSRFNRDLARASTSIDIIVMKSVQSGTQILVTSYILLKSDVTMTLAVLAVGTVHFVLTHFMSGWVRRSNALASNGQAMLSAALQESFQNIQLIKVFTAEEYDKKRVTYAAEKLRKSFFRFILTRYVEQPIRLITDGGVAAAVLWLCYFSITKNRMSAQGTALFFYMAGQLVQPMSEIGKNILTLNGLHGSIQGVLNLMKKESIIINGSEPVTGLHKSIEFKNVSFSYKRGNPVIDDICFTLERGETTAVVGPSGSGKSTIIQLLLRLYDPEEGTIFLDGNDIRKFEIEKYRHLFGVVSQECQLFHTSIKENILLGRPFDEDELWRVCNIAYLGEFINSLSEKMGTIVGERGVLLSGGQRQRLAIARAIYGRPEILVLDEATSALDTESEKVVQDAIECALAELSGIVIAHRLSTIKNANNIVIISKGRVEGMGSHEELLKSSTMYQKLYNLQF